MRPSSAARRCAAALALSVALAQPAFAADAPNTPFTLADVAKHAKPTDCWSAINGIVYDLTPFIASGHEGGLADIQLLCGVDGSPHFREAPPSHTAAYLDAFVTRLGVLVAGAAVAPPTPSAVATPSAAPPSTTAAAPAATKARAPAAKSSAKRTITCRNLKTRKLQRITAVKPTCPKGTTLVR